MVLKLLSSSDEDEKAQAQVTLDEGFQEVKKIAQEYKKHLKSSKNGEH